MLDASYTVPMRADWKRARAREAAIVADYEEERHRGITAPELAKRYRISDARAWQILHKHFGYLRALDKKDL